MSTKEQLIRRKYLQILSLNFAVPTGIRTRALCVKVRDANHIPPRYRFPVKFPRATASQNSVTGGRGFIKFA